MNSSAAAPRAKNQTSASSLASKVNGTKPSPHKRDEIQALSSLATARRRG
jgi:hypothetical protein